MGMGMPSVGFEEGFEVTVVDPHFLVEEVVYASYEVWYDAPVPRRKRTPAWMEDPAAVAAIIYVAHLKVGHVIQDGSVEEEEIEPFRHVLPGALAYNGRSLERVPGGWRVCGTI